MNKIVSCEGTGLKTRIPEMESWLHQSLLTLSRSLETPCPLESKNTHTTKHRKNIHLLDLTSKIRSYFLLLLL